MTNAMSKNKKFVLTAFILIMLFSQSTKVFSCEKKSLQELIYMEKSDLIKFVCLNDSDYVKHDTSRDKNISKSNEEHKEYLFYMKTGNYDLSKMYEERYNNALKRIEKNGKDIRCNIDNSKNAKNVLRKDHKIKIENFYDSYCAELK